MSLAVQLPNVVVKGVMRTDGTCMPDDDLIDHLAQRLRSTDDGKGTYRKACATTDHCEWVAKIVPLHNDTDIHLFDLELAISTFASEKGFGPKILRHWRCGHQRRTSWWMKLKQAFGIHPTSIAVVLLQNLEGTIGDVILQPSDSEQIDAKVRQMHDAGIWHSFLGRSSIWYYTQQGQRHWCIDGFTYAWPFLNVDVPEICQRFDHSYWKKRFDKKFSFEDAWRTAAQNAPLETLRLFDRADLSHYAGIEAGISSSALKLMKIRLRAV